MFKFYLFVFVAVSFEQPKLQDLAKRFGPKKADHVCLHRRGATISPFCFGLSSGDPRFLGVHANPLCMCMPLLESG